MATMKLPVCAVWLGVVSAGCTSASDGALKIAACPAAASDPVTLGTLTMDHEQLFVDVTTSGCAKHTFSVCWDGALADSEPPQIILPLSHDAHGDMCATMATSLVQIDLSPVFAKFAPPWIARVQIAGDQSGASSSVFVPAP
jgi:hypothetical protein